MSRRLLLPIAILVAGLLAFVLMLVTRSEVERVEPEVVAPLVRVVTVTARTIRLEVEAHGTVEPPIESELRAQVAGEVVWVSPRLSAGGFFEPGEALARLDPTDHANELEAARADRDRAKSALSVARREHERQQELFSRSAASVARTDEARDAYLAAEAELRSAEVRVARAEHDLARTEIRAPYAGRSREKSVDVGQFVRPGDELARLYSIASAEVPLPLSDHELAYLDLPHPFRSESGSELESGPAVVLRAEFAGVPASWEGRLVRTSAEIDPRSRTVTVVARVDDPYGRAPGGPPIPLPVGLFVEAHIEGREVPQAVTLPTPALHDGGRVYVVDDESRLHFRDVDVLRIRRDEVVVRSGLASGERVVVSPLRGAVEGMSVRVADEPPPTAAAPPVAEPAR
ncbi:MAG: efflux RND transporter periplasmic adaptor subunit [Spirochaetaceae bacterium]|nr:efflux RND transporter periplasmic adaptor subunit [Myxococcales bacterium]MCB9726667.1 efflux RND transporter periplasmic adaptor subunit [Spirochaetaceae bacterium]HPG24825.1 efflux RND transporter periplasmic adaptor subunit [Myxococcota bacterium]